MSLNSHALTDATKALDALSVHAFLTRCAVGEVSFRRWLIDLCSAEGMFFSHDPIESAPSLDDDQIARHVKNAIKTATPEPAPTHGLRVISNPVPPIALPFVRINTDSEPPACA